MLNAIPLSATPLNAIPWTANPLNAIPLNATPLRRMVYKNNAILLSKVRRKYKKHYSTGCKHVNNKTINVLAPGRDFMQKKMYSRNFTVSNKTFCLSLHYNGDNSYLFVNCKQVVNFKFQDFKPRHVYPMCLGNISSDFNQADRKSTGLNGYIYDFSFYKTML